MFCSRCGANNPDDAKQCQSCGMELNPVVPNPAGTVDFKEILRNKNALLILAFLAVPMFAMIFGAMWYWYGSPFGYPAVAGKSPPYYAGSKPMGIAIDASGNAWVTSRGSNTVTKLNQSGNVIGSYKVGKSPVGIAIDASGNVWIADLGSNSVTKLAPDGHTLGTFTSGSGPYGITVDAFGNAWVANFKDNTVTKLSPSGTELGSYQVASRGPLGLSGGLNGIVIDASGNIWVTNDDDNSVIKLTPSGSIIGTYPAGGSPVGLAIDRDGNVLIACADGITELGPDGNRIATYDNQVLATGPESIAIDASGNIWVSVSSDSDVIELSPDGTILKTYMIGQSHEGIVVDASGNVWITNFVNGTVSEIIGAAKGPQYFPYKGPVFPGGGNI